MMMNAASRVGVWLACTWLAVAPSGVVAQERLSFPHFGVSLIPPAGAQRTAEPNFDTVGSWVILDQEDPTGWDSTFQLGMWLLRDRNFGEVVQELASKVGATPEPSEWKMDGHATKQLTVQEDKRRIQYVVCEVSGFFVQVVYVSVLPPRHERTFDAFTASLKFSKPQAPHQHLVVRRHPMQIAGSTIVFDALEPMRLLELNEQALSSEYGVQNYRDDRSELLLTVRITDMPAHMTFEQICSTLGASIKLATGLTDTPTFQDVPARCRVALSDLLWRERKSADGTLGRVANRYVIASQTPGEIAFFQFDLIDLDEEVARAYSNGIARLARTIRPGDAYHEGRSLVEEKAEGG
jgi:hypothetical protein